MAYYNYYFARVLAYLQFNKYNFRDYCGYYIDPVKDQIVIHLLHKRIKIQINNLERFYAVLKGE